MRRVLATLVIAVMALSAVPWGSSVPGEKEELDRPDMTIYDFESDPVDENKTEELLRGGSSLSTQSVNVTIKRKDSSSRERGTVMFPYSKFGWRIDRCYRTSNGLRLYGIYYEDEKILYDYRVPWVELDGTRYPLEKDDAEGAPTLYVWNTREAFKVEVSYEFEAGDAVVEVKEYCYFWSDGSFDPWVIADCSPHEKDIRVGQRFDFDLDGASDDNADYYTSLGWELIEIEDNYPDAGEPEHNGVQWSLCDTDWINQEDIKDQIVDIIPYGIDDASLHILRYHAGEISGDPSSYDNDETTGLYSSSTYEAIGKDLVAWYVSDYEDTTWCNPGPWTEVEV